MTEIAFDYDKYDFKDSTENYVYKGKRGVSEEIIKMISEKKSHCFFFKDSINYFKVSKNKKK